MKQLKYVGPHDVVEIETAPRLWTEVTQNQTVQVGDALATALLEQPDNWTEVTKKAAGKKAAVQTDEDQS